LQAAALAPGQPPTPDHAPPPGEGVTPPPPEPEEPTTAPETDPTPSGPLDERAQAAVEDLAERLGVDPEAIEVGPLEDVTWPDGSIGCPQPGQHYTQALVPGARPVLTVDGEPYAYHGKGEEPLFYCASPTEPAPSDAATA